MGLVRRTISAWVNDAAEPTDNASLVWDAPTNRWVVRPAVEGRATLVGGTVTVPNTSVTAASNIFVHRQTDGGTVGASYSITRSVGVSFTITAKAGDGAGQAADTSTLAYTILEP